jgi:hypothetical protein
MQDRVDPEHLRTPHYVEWSAIPGGEEERDVRIEYFMERSKAAEFAEIKDQARYAVWLAEIGTYKTERGNTIRDYMYYWWNEKSVWGERFGRGCGYPCHAQSKLIDYVPFDSSR